MHASADTVSRTNARHCCARCVQPSSSFAAGCYAAVMHCCAKCAPAAVVTVATAGFTVECANNCGTHVDTRKRARTRTRLRTRNAYKTIMTSSLSTTQQWVCVCMCICCSLEPVFDSRIYVHRNTNTQAHTNFEHALRQSNTDTHRHV